MYWPTFLRGKVQQNDPTGRLSRCHLWGIEFCLSGIKMDTYGGTPRVGDERGLAPGRVFQNFFKKMIASLGVSGQNTSTL